jgi:hypothetical protein
MSGGVTGAGVDGPVGLHEALAIAREQAITLIFEAFIKGM